MFACLNFWIQIIKIKLFEYSVRSHVSWYESKLIDLSGTTVHYKKLQCIVLEVWNFRGLLGSGYSINLKSSLSIGFWNYTLTTIKWLRGMHEKFLLMTLDLLILLLKCSTCVKPHAHHFFAFWRCFEHLASVV